VHVRDNQQVRAGELLFEIDPADYDLKVAESEAALKAEQARLAQSDTEIKVAQADVMLQEASLRQASQDKKRADALYRQQVIPRERFEKALTAFKINVAQVKSSKEKLKKAMTVKQLEESLTAQKEASLKIAKLNAGYTKIYAPSSGYITSKGVETGNQLQAEQSVMALVDLDDIWVVANYKETQLKNVRPGQRVALKVDTYPGHIFYGKVDSIMAGTGAVFSLFPPENALGNYVKIVQRIPVKIVLDRETDPDHILRVGMSCVPVIYTRDE
jgi:membrane fusion protein, multidrug efflux system